MQLLTVVITFQAEVGATNPHVAAWVVEKYHGIQADLSAWRKVWWWVGPGRKTRLRTVAETLGEMTAKLAQWSAGTLSDKDLVT